MSVWVGHIPTTEEVQETGKCNICFEPLLSGDALEEPIKLPCGHILGVNCMLRSAPTALGEPKESLILSYGGFHKCPVCRRDIARYIPFPELKLFRDWLTTFTPPQGSPHDLSHNPLPGRQQLPVNLQIILTVVWVAWFFLSKMTIAEVLSGQQDPNWDVWLVVGGLTAYSAFMFKCIGLGLLCELGRL